MTATKRLTQKCDTCGFEQNWYVELSIIPANESKYSDITGCFCFDCTKSILNGSEVNKRQKEKGKLK